MPLFYNRPRNEGPVSNYRKVGGEGWWSTKWKVGAKTSFIPTKKGDGKSFSQHEGGRGGVSFDVIIMRDT